MDRARNDLLSRSALSTDENVRLGICDLRDKIEDSPNRGTVPDDRAISILTP